MLKLSQLLMKRILVPNLLVIALLITSNLALAEIVSFKDNDKTWKYDLSNVLGWKLYVEESVSKQKDLDKIIKKEVTDGIKRFINVVPKESLEFLKTIPIWVSNEPTYPLRENERGVIPFHHDENWLRDHGLNPHMAPGVHVINPEAALVEHKIFEWGPMTMLHELAHAYHIVHLGYDDSNITKSFTKAMARGLYLKVPDRKDKEKLVKAYAASNKAEYFAEATEAYFGHNDWFPHNRKELKKYDPGGFKMVEQAWGVKTKEKTIPSK